ncbi:phage portal protein [Marinibacterium profundimaris]|uniref:Portal protein n=1 Tax=Marinibacterium profundimaris TaxID=1679460 RepID=A0A225NW58_9RHOB|nr:phage portal protein [Marinibacterium profundimaris]OWU77607.1 portal protein [Marinibacterium profundimaris]
MVVRFMKAAMRGVRAELAAGESGWEVVSSANAWHGMGYTSNSGQTVSVNSALTLSAAWACVKGNSEAIGSLPLAVYEKQSNGSRQKIEPDLAEVLTTSPNRGQTGLEFWEANAAHLLLRGNFYAERLMIGRRLVGLRPIFNVTPKRRDDGQFDYHFTEDGGRHVLPPERVFHVRGFGGGDGLGMSAIKYGTQSLGAALAADVTASKVFANGMMPAGLLKSDQELDPDQRGQLQNMLADFVGSNKAGKTMVLESGLEYSALSLNPEDAQLLDTRRFGVEDVCRWFGTPPVVIGHAGQGQTMWGTGVEAIMLAWLRTGINPILRRNETRVLKDLIPPERRGKWFVEWNREAMLQMDSRAKGDFLSRMVAAGVMSSDESRDKLNLPRRGGAADDLRAQVATAPIDMLGRDKG